MKGRSHLCRLCGGGTGMIVAVVVGVLTWPSIASAQCDPNWVQRTPPTAPPVRGGHAMAYDSVRGVTVLFGGDVGGGVDANDTWEWDGTVWTQRSPATLPHGRSAHAMAYDSVRGVTVLFGGECHYPGQICGNDTWEWDGTNWSQRSPLAAPSARKCLSMAYDSARRVTVLFGGYDGSSPVNDTWEWDGTNWTHRSPADSPPPRMVHAATYDSARGVTVLFGGQYWYGDTWEWDGINWTQRTPPVAPSPRYGASMAYDTSRGVSVLFGGRNSVYDFLADTWEWDGGAWTQRTPPTVPSGREAHAMAYDSARGVTVLFGGWNGNLLGDTWEYQPPLMWFAQQPVATTIVEGSDAGFGITVATSQFARITYGWRRNGVPIPWAAGVDKAFLRIPSAGREDAGSYDVVVTAGGCQLVSNAATLTVNWRADFDDDADVDLDDFRFFQMCFNGPNQPPGAWCP